MESPKSREAKDLSAYNKFQHELKLLNSAKPVKKKNRYDEKIDEDMAIPPGEHLVPLKLD